MGFFEENWFWRGTQSAIFYYISCAPCIEAKYKRKRRNEAHRAKKDRSDVITTQPGIVSQPAAFQTNHDWLEEILMGPGPPKGWKRDPIANVATVSDMGKPSRSDDEDGRTHDDLHIPRARDFAEETNAPATAISRAAASDSSPLSNLSPGLNEPESSTAGRQHAGRHSSRSSSSSSASREVVRRPRPSLEKRFSTAMDNLRGTLRSSMRPEKWNWIRYDRDDETLTGFNQRMTEMWNRAALGLGMTDKASSENLPDASGQRRRRDTDVQPSQHFDFQQYTRNPEINEMHPPTVSRLPTTRDEAAWMTLPPPSAAVMEGKSRPQDEVSMRWPLARIGRSAEEWAMLRQQNAMDTPQSRSGSAQAESVPELSDSFTDATGSSDEESLKSTTKRHPLPIAPVDRRPVLDWTGVKREQRPRDHDSAWTANSRSTQEQAR